MEQSRRTFARKAGMASAFAAGTLLNLNPRASGANDKITLALIGGRNQGWGVAVRAIEQGAEIKTHCDIDEEILYRINPILEKAQKKAPASALDYRRVLDDKDIDGVIIATPDHWHAHMTLLACQAGKDVYVEKPLTHTIHEGHLVRDAARKYNRVVQMGTQNRSVEHVRSAVEYVASGKLGKICLIQAWECQLRPSIGRPPDCAVPPGLNYDVWLGPAPQRPFNQNRFHYNWRFFWDYGNSELGNQGVHLIDIALWAIQSLGGVANSLPARVSSNGGIYWLDDAKEVPDTQVACWDYGKFLLTWELRSFARHHPAENSKEGVTFHGTEATLMVDYHGWQVFPKADAPLPHVKPSGGSHEKNFLDCVRSRKKPNADVELARLSTTLCHIANISCRLGRDLRFDPKSETFGDDEEANARLTKEYRKEYPLPAV